jgi:hypothetical protein
MQLPALNFPSFDPRIRQTENRTEIFDPVRRTFIALSPEEWVRQHLIHHLVAVSAVPPGLIAVEKEIPVNRLSKRFDVVVYDPNAKPVMIAECKAPSVKISNDAFNQALRYNLALNIRFMLLTNGLKHFCFQLDYSNGSSLMMDHIPTFAEMVGEGS